MTILIVIIKIDANILSTIELVMRGLGTVSLDPSPLITDLVHLPPSVHCHIYELERLEEVYQCWDSTHKDLMTINNNILVVIID